MKKETEEEKYVCNCGYAQGIAHWHSPGCTIFYNSIKPTQEPMECEVFKKTGGHFFTEGGSKMCCSILPSQNLVEEHWEEEWDKNYAVRNLGYAPAKEHNDAIKQFISNLIKQAEEREREKIVEKIKKECKFEYFLRSSSGNIVRSVISKKDEMRNEMADQIINLITNQ